MITREAMLRMYLTAITIVCLGLAGVSGVKIIDGTVAVPHSWPYMAYLKIIKEREVHMCGGILIYPNVILTAAHCKGKNITVILGAHFWSENEKSQQTIPVQEMIPHEAYNNKTFENDIMILKLKSNATITKEVKTIQLPSKDERFVPGTTCSVAGWGSTISSGTQSNVLREVTVKIQERCYSASLICARGTGRKGICVGDSGGPLVCQGRNNIPTAAGIVSYSVSYNCEDADRHDVYVKVSAYLNWIKTKIEVSSSA
ncbi:GRAB protein, partial [Polypterus senegalus]|nr:mast cell protease 1A-like [Polypterus senegalus]MBN3289057.1 GRAB protein [Polypterus senegalus]